MSHTPTPWEQDGPGGDRIEARHDEYELVAQLIEGDVDENGRRIVAAINALEGIATEELENDIIHEAYRTLLWALTEEEYDEEYEGSVFTCRECGQKEYGTAETINHNDDCILTRFEVEQ